MKIYTLNEILKTGHIGDEKYVRYEEIEQLGKEKEWISVKDRLPQEGRAILIYTDYGKQATAYLSDNLFIDWMRPQHSYGSVTHWMPVPNPPEMQQALKESG